MTAQYLTDAQRQAYHRDGYLLLPGLFSPAEAAELAAMADELADWPQTPGAWMMYFEDSQRPPGGRLLSRIENFHPYHPGFRALLDGPRLRGLAGDLFGEPAVLFKDKINFKLPGGGGFAPHQDIQAGWDAYAPLFITALVAIDPATPDNGCLELAAGQHRRGPLGRSWEPLSATDLQGIEFEPCPTAPGDVVFFDSNVPHRSAPNHTDRPRRVLYVTYNRRAEGDHRARYYADKRRSYPPDCEREPGRRYVFRV